MDIDRWISYFGDRVDPGMLVCSDAAALSTFVSRHAEQVARLVEVRSAGDRELVILDFQTGRPQQSAYPIKQTERIGVRFTVGGAMPIVYMLRADFPDTEHQQLTIEGSPRAICIDDRPWPEARLTWTPAEFVHRILSWFSRAARGELHDARQPVDPVLSGSPLSFLMPRAILHNASDLDLVGVHDENHRQTLRVMPIQQIHAPAEQLEPICVVAYRVPPELMRRMVFAPANLGSLADMLSERGIDLFADLSARLSAWITEAEPAAWRLSARFAVVVEMPIVSPRGEQQDGTDMRAYITDVTGGDIACALGVAFKTEHPDEGSKVGYVRIVGAPTVDHAAVRGIASRLTEVHYEFDRKLATQLAGRVAEDERSVVMIGAGAIGSHVSDCLMREGRFSWTVVDDDYLLPHNLARHIGRSSDVTKSKAHIVAQRLSGTLHSETPAAQSIAANLHWDRPHRAEIDTALSNADLIIDATASVLAERFLSDHPAAARRVSIFFNPNGTGVVLLAEPEDRACTLRDLEAQYLGLAGTDERLVSHLSPPSGVFAYTGACRAITNLIPESCVMILSGLVAGAFGKAVDAANGAIRIWSLADDGAVEALTFNPEPVTRLQAGDWAITLDEGLVRRIMSMRAEKLPNETGGILFGVIDIPEKSLHIVSAAPAPLDSKASRTGFTRGVVGVQESIDTVSDRTKGQVRYIGEWHSHPPSVAPTPSATDIVQIDWLATLFDMDTLPALMLIAGDDGVRVVLANREAVPVVDGDLPTAKSA